MTDKKGIAQDGYQPLKKGYQPKSELANNGYQPSKQTQQSTQQQEQLVNPPPKKP